ncbi:MAG: hypothetical protein ACMUHU_00885 [Thermoplasmatota archaeon]
MTARPPPDELELVLEMMGVDPCLKEGDRILDTIHFRSSILHGPVDDGIEIGVDIGRQGSDQKISLPVPFLVSKKFLSSLPDNAKLGIALGQAMAGIPVNIYPGAPDEIKELIKVHDPLKIVNFGPKRDGFDLEVIRSSDLMEIDVMDEVNGSPRSLPEVEKGKDLIRLIDLLDEVTPSPKAIIMEPGHIIADIDFYLVTRLDLLGLNCRPYPDGRCTNSFVLSSMTQALRHMGTFKSMDKGMKLMVTVRAMDPSDLVKVFALGANIICLDILTLDFLKAYLRTKSNLPPDDDIDLHDHDEAIDWAEIGELYSEMVNYLSDGIRETLRDLNIGSLDRLTKEHLITTDYNTASITGIALSGFGGPVPFWRHRSE